MASRTFIGWCGVAAMLGGVLWVTGAIIIALKPAGCIGAACDLPGRSMRAGAATDAALFTAALLLIALGGAALVILARRAGRFGRLGRMGLIAGIVGVVLLLAAGLIQALFFGGDFLYMPIVVIPAGLALVVGFVLLGVAVLRSGVVPRWTAVLLVCGSLAMLGFNDQNAQALMAIPFGIAWVAAGFALWSRQGEQPIPV